MRISHLATSPKGSKLAAGEFERTVHIWDLKSRQRISVFDTVLSFGGHRLAISSDGKVCIAGAYLVEGVVAYSTTTGKIVWCRKDLKKVQRIRISNDDQRVFCCFDAKPCQILDRRTGKTISMWPGVRNLWLSAVAPVALVEKNSGVLVRSLRGEEALRLDCKPRVGLLAAAFSSDRCVISESAGPLRCFDLNSGRERWSFAPEPGEHFLDVARVDRDKLFVGICWPFEHGGKYRLLQIDPDSGVTTKSTVLPNCNETAFYNDGSRLLLNTGLVFDAVTGKRERPLTIPKQ
jgi:WD40 repeat protein